jgi:hypothetical protein
MTMVETRSTPSTQFPKEGNDQVSYGSSFLSLPFRYRNKMRWTGPKLEKIILMITKIREMNPTMLDTPLTQLAESPSGTELDNYAIFLNTFAHRWFCAANAPFKMSSISRSLAAD